MKTMTPIYVLLTLILAAFVIFGILLLKEEKAIRTELVEIRTEQIKQSVSDRPSRGGPALRVEVVNTPTVEIDGSVDVNVDDPLDVNVVNEPTVDIAT